MMEGPNRWAVQCPGQDDPGTCQSSAVTHGDTLSKLSYKQSPQASEFFSTIPCLRLVERKAHIFRPDLSSFLIESDMRPDACHLIIHWSLRQRYESQTTAEAFHFSQHSYSPKSVPPESTRAGRSLSICPVIAIVLPRTTLNSKPVV